MESAQTAEAVLEIRIEPRGGRGLRRVPFLLFAVLVALLGDAVPLSDLVIARKGSGEDVVRSAAPMDPGLRDWLIKRMRETATASSESEFLSKWGNPSNWTYSA